jgi:hypothetical protein
MFAERVQPESATYDATGLFRSLSLDELFAVERACVHRYLTELWQAGRQAAANFVADIGGSAGVARERLRAGKETQPALILWTMYSSHDLGDILSVLSELSAEPGPTGPLLAKFAEIVGVELAGRAAVTGMVC